MMYLLVLFFLLLSGLLSMQWIAEVVTLNQASSQYGHLVQWWMTHEQKVLSPIIFLGLCFIVLIFI